MDFEEKNHPSESIESFGEIDWYDVCEAPIELYGACDKRHFLRMEPSVAERVNEFVKRFYGNTAGIRARFATDSPFFAVYFELAGLNGDNTMPLSGTSGFDFYDVENGRYEWTISPSYGETVIERARLFRNKCDIHNITMNFPLYNSVNKVYIGIKKNCKMFKGKEYDNKKIVYYGSSITQGADASRPGMCYQNIIARRTNYDYINLGFSSGALGEDIMADYIGDIKMDLFVMDYDYNAPDPEHLEKTHERFFKRFRAKQPDTPVLFLSSPSVPDEETDKKRTSIIEKTYSNAVKSGDKNVYFINGKSCFYDLVGRDYTVDGTHPNDAGFVRMAEVIGSKIISIFKK